MLGWFADAPDPDAGLFGFRQISEALGSDALVPPDAARRGPGRAAARHAARHQPLRDRPAAAGARGVRMLATDEALIPLRPAALRKEMTSAASRHDDPVDAVTAVRAVRRRELFRIAAADLFGLLDVEDVGYALTDVTDATLEAALVAAVDAIEAERRTSAADPDRGRGDGSLRRGRARLRQRRRRDVRARPAAGLQPRGRRAGSARRGQRVPPAAVAAGHRPGARPRRRPAAGGQAGPAGAHARLLRRLLRQVVGGVGGAGAAAGQGDRRRPGPVPSLHAS